MELGTLREMVQELILIIIIAGILDMLLPESPFRKFIRVVVGLFVIITILGPLSEFIDPDKSWEIEAWRLPQPDNAAVATVLSAGKQLSSGMNMVVEKDYSERLAQQIEAMVDLVPGVKQSRAKVRLKPGTEIYDQGSIEHLILDIYQYEEDLNDSPGQETDKIGVGPVSIPAVSVISVQAKQDIKPIRQSSGERQEIAERVQGMVEKFFGVPQESIEVRFPEQPVDE